MDNNENEKYKDSTDMKKKDFRAPPSLSVLPYINSRKSEINEFLKAITTKKSNTRAFQSLPRYLRRRTMSHNVYRLPIHLRKRAQNEIEKSAQTNKSEGTKLLREKTVVRKAKRRPAYLLRDYERRQKTFKWLETHIWHAKRMKMLSIWGHKIAKSINGKGVRSTFRASSHFCTLYDCSYYQCIEITGLESKIINFFSTITDPNSIPISNKSYLTGSREGAIDIYYIDRFPFHFICPAKFLWKQQDNNNSSSISSSNINNERKIWVWIHPAALNEIIYIFEKGANQFNLSIKNLEQQLQRFELTGSKSHSILNSILYLNQQKQKQQQQNNENKDQLESNQVWSLLNTLRTPATLPKGTVISLKVHDPRLVCRIPEEVALQVRSIAKPDIKKDKDTTTTTTTTKIHHSVNQIIVNWNTICKQVAVSDLWDDEKRSYMTKNIEPNHKVNERRKKIKDLNDQKNTFTKEDDNNNNTTPSTPTIMLIQRDGGLTRGYGSGWDIIIPGGWGLAFWIPLIYAGAWSIGLEDRDRMLLEQGLPSFPRDYPDSKSCDSYYDMTTIALEQKFKRTPPSKRINYLKNSVFFPFRPCWSWILKYNKNEILDFNKPSSSSSSSSQQKEENNIATSNQEEHKSKKLKNIIGTGGEIILSPQPYFVYRGKLALSLLDPSNYPIMKNNINIPFNQETINEANDRGLVRVSIKMFNRGKPLPNSIIYEPLESDIQLLANKYYSRDYKSIELITPKLTKNNIPTSIEQLYRYYDQMTRKPIGYVINGEQSLVRGFGNGIGFCSAVDFIRLHNLSTENNYSPKGFAFIQNPKSKTLYPIILTIQP
ncbi:hypothetical protein ACTA71_007530 [Dictyostelium dimigraforme]